MDKKSKTNKTDKNAHKKGGGFSEEERLKGLEVKRKTTKKNKKLFLQVYELTMGNISHSCKKINISRSSYERWMKTDKKFSKQVQDIKESNLDLTETMLMSNIKDGKEASIFFKLKTQGRDRGYIERQEIVHDQKNKYESMTIEELETELLKYDK